MKNLSLEWSAADTKFVEAILLATGGEGGATLQDILLMGDALEGTVFSLSELEHVLLKLTAVDYLQIQKNKLSLTPSFQAAYEAANAAVVDVSDKEIVEELLNCQVLSEQKLAEAKEQLKKYKLKNYYQQYQEQFG